MEILSAIFKNISIAFFVIFFFGFCVFIHELGHLLVALWRGMYVESFSIGFGKKLWGFKYKNVEYKVSMLPFGGYVELPQLNSSEIITDSKGNILPPVKPLDRLLTAFAGPFFNILFGVFLGLFVWFIGIEKPTPAAEVEVATVVAESPEAKAGLQVGDIITKVNGASFTNGFTEVFEKIVLSSEAEINLTIKRGAEEKVITFVPESSKNPLLEKLPAPQFSGSHEMEVAQFSKNSPAENAGIKLGDKIISINNEKLLGLSDFNQKMLKLSSTDVLVGIERAGNVLQIPVTAILSKNFEIGATIKILEEGKIEIENILANSPAERIGLEKGMIFSELDGEKMSVENLRDKVFYGEGNEVRFLGDRGEFKMVPQENTKSQKFLLGVVLEPKIEMQIEHKNPFEQFIFVIEKTKNTLKALFSRKSKVSTKHMSGPIGIVRAMAITVDRGGFLYGIELVIFISFSLAIMNLLPLPVLDGGHIMLSTFETVFRRRMPVSFVSKLETVCAVVLISFMLYVTFYDAKRLVTPTEVEEQITIKI